MASYKSWVWNSASRKTSNSMLRSSENQSLWTCAQMKTSVDGEIPQVNASKQINAQTPVDWFPRAPAPHHFLKTALITHRPTRPGIETILVPPSPVLLLHTAPRHHIPLHSNHSPSRVFYHRQPLSCCELSGPFQGFQLMTRPSSTEGWAGARGWSVNSRCAQKKSPPRCGAATAYLLNLVFLLHHTVPKVGRKNPTVPSLLWMHSSSFHK